MPEEKHYFSMDVSCTSLSRWTGLFCFCLIARNCTGGWRGVHVHVHVALVPYMCIHVYTCVHTPWREVGGIYVHIHAGLHLETLHGGQKLKVGDFRGVT